MSEFIKGRVESARRSLVERAKATLRKYGEPCPDAQAAEIERLTRERDAARERSGELRICLNCGKMRPANEEPSDLPECHHPDYPGLAGCTWQLTPQEAWEHWRKVAYNERTRADAAEAEVEALRAALRSIDGMVQEATRAPLTADRWLDRIEECARDALGQKP